MLPLKNASAWRREECFWHPFEVGGESGVRRRIRNVEACLDVGLLGSKKVWADALKDGRMCRCKLLVMLCSAGKSWFG